MKTLSLQTRIPTTGPHIVIDSDYFPNPTDTTGHLPPVAHHHISKVLRKKPGDSLSLTDGNGHVFQAVISSIDGSSTAYELQKTYFFEPNNNQLTIKQALPKGKKIDEVIRRACEVGVDTFVPIASMRSERKLSGERASRALQRWQTIAISAAEQSRRPYVMTIQPIEALAKDPKAFVLWEESTITLVEQLAANGFMAPSTGSRPTIQRDLTLVVGPEGGFDAKEIEASEMISCALGPTILRTETAAVAAAIIGSWYLGRMN